jgi:Tfp pilus assembly protein PilN
MRAVNLLPRDHQQKGVGLPSTPVLVGLCSGVLVVALLGADYMLESSKVSKEQQSLASLQARVRALPPAPEGPTAAQTELAGEHSARVTALSAALANRVAWDRVLRDFSLVLPNDVWLTSLSANAPVVSTAPPTPGSPAAPAPGATGFSITGYTYSHDAVARLLSRLQVIPDLSNVTLVNSMLSGSIVQFTINANIRTASSGSSS